MTDKKKREKLTSLPLPHHPTNPHRHRTTVIRKEARLIRAPVTLRMAMMAGTMGMVKMMMMIQLSIGAEW
jgi:hypothetical protein